MIRVNLSKKAKKKKSGGGGLTGSIALTDLIAKLKGSGASIGASSDFDFKNSSFMKVILIVAALYAGNYWIEDQKQKKLDIIRVEQANVQAEINRLNTALDKTKGYETVKQQLEASEQTVRTKLETINKLLADRAGPSKMLIQVAQIIPGEVWLTSMKVTDQTVDITGGTPGYTEVSDFLKSLSESSFLYDPKISGIEEKVSTAKDQLYQDFQISASRRHVQ